MKTHRTLRIQNQWQAPWLLTLSLACFSALAVQASDVASCTAHLDKQVVSLHCPQATLGQLTRALQETEQVKVDLPVALKEMPVSIVGEGAFTKLLDQALGAYSYGLGLDESAGKLLYSLTLYEVVPSKETAPGQEEPPVLESRDAGGPEDKGALANDTVVGRQEQREQQGRSQGPAHDPKPQSQTTVAEASVPAKAWDPENAQTKSKSKSTEVTAWQGPNDAANSTSLTARPLGQAFTTSMITHGPNDSDGPELVTNAPGGPGRTQPTPIRGTSSGPGSNGPTH
jgi:hypothetical protein